jgi:hypothetical protein
MQAMPPLGYANHALTCCLSLFGRGSRGRTQFVSSATLSVAWYSLPAFATSTQPSRPTKTAQILRACPGDALQYREVGTRARTRGQLFSAGRACACTRIFFRDPLVQTRAAFSRNQTARNSTPSSRSVSEFRLSCFDCLPARGMSGNLELLETAGY